MKVIANENEKMDRANISQIIEEIKNLIVTKLDPEKIILFGSCAKGEIGRNTDIDLFIVKKSNLDMHRRMIEARDVIPYCYPVDVIVYTPEEYENYKNNKWSFLYRIIKEGHIIYERK